MAPRCIPEEMMVNPASATDIANKTVTDISVDYSSQKTGQSGQSAADAFAAVLQTMLRQFLTSGSSQQDGGNGFHLNFGNLALPSGSVSFNQPTGNAQFPAHTPTASLPTISFQWTQSPSTGQFGQDIAGPKIAQHATGPSINLPIWGDLSKIPASGEKNPLWGDLPHAAIFDKDPLLGGIQRPSEPIQISYHSANDNQHPVALESGVELFKYWDQMSKSQRVAAMKQIFSGISVA